MLGEGVCLRCPCAYYHSSWSVLKVWSRKPITTVHKAYALPLISLHWRMTQKNLLSYRIESCDITFITAMRLQVSLHIFQFCLFQLMNGVYKNQRFTHGLTKLIVSTVSGSLKSQPAWRGVLRVLTLWVLIRSYTPNPTKSEHVVVSLKVRCRQFFLLKIGTITEFHIESISVFLDNMNHLLLWSDDSHLYEKVVIIWFSSFSFPVF